MTGFRAALFDLDGTLLDTALDFYWVVDRMLLTRGMPAVDRRHFRQYVSDGSRAMVSTAFNLAPDSPEVSPLLDEFLALYTDHLMVKARLFDGLSELLDWLDAEQLHWGVVTNKPERFSRRILEKLSLGERCATLICPEQVKNRKPDPESLLLASTQLNCPPHATLYIGDHPRDIEAGRRAGMQTVACAYGYIHDDENPALWGADYVVADTRELNALLNCLHHAH